MVSDGKRAVQPKRNEWGYPDTYDGDNYNDNDPGGGGEVKWPEPPVPPGYVNEESLDKALANLVGRARTAVQSITAEGGLYSRQSTSDTTKIALGIARDGVGNNELVDDAVTTTKIADGSIYGTKIPSQGITSSHLGTNSIGNRAMQANSVDTNNVRDKAITKAKLASDVTSGLMTGDVPEITHLSGGLVNVGALVTQLNPILDVLAARGIITIKASEETEQ